MASPLRGRTSAVFRRTPGAATLWGDGFARDSVFDLWAVRDWSLCSPDEYVLLFPRLVAAEGGFPAALRAHLEDCVSARAWRIAKLDGLALPMPMRSRLPNRANGAAFHRDWFADDGAVTCLLRRAGLLRTAPGRLESERRVVAFLDGLLFEIQAGLRPPRDESSEVLLAFGAGIHPAYLWPEAALSQARGLAAGWLGHLDRGRTALMPMAVAEYLLEALGDETAVDRQLMALAGGAASLGRLRRAARRRSAGRDPSVRLTPEAAPLMDFLSGRTRLTRAPKVGA